MQKKNPSKLQKWRTNYVCVYWMLNTYEILYHREKRKLKSGQTKRGGGWVDEISNRNSKKFKRQKLEWLK